MWSPNRIWNNHLLSEKKTKHCHAQKHRLAIVPLPVQIESLQKGGGHAWASHLLVPHFASRWTGERDCTVDQRQASITPGIQILTAWPARETNGWWSVCAFSRPPLLVGPARTHPPLVVSPSPSEVVMRVEFRRRKLRDHRRSSPTRRAGCVVVNTSTVAPCRAGRPGRAVVVEHIDRAGRCVAEWSPDSEFQSSSGAHEL